MINLNNFIHKGKTADEILKFESDFLRRVKSDTNPFQHIEKSITDKNLSLDNDAQTILLDQISDNESTVLQYIKDQFNKIILGSPKELENHITNIKAIEEGIIGTRSTTPPYHFITTEFGKGLFTIFGYDDFFRTKKKKGIWLAEKLNIKCCPYCNGQYTLFTKNEANTEKAKFQFDHFFSKKKYPYLSLSLYNLIPACAPCNLSKGDMEMSLTKHYHPYHKALSLRSKFKVKYDVSVQQLSIGDVSELPIDISFTSRFKEFEDLVQEHNRIYDLEALYNRHTDIVEDLLHKAIVNNSVFKDQMMKIRGLFNGDERLYKRYVIGNFAFEDEILNRPLAKFTQDVAKQLGVI